MTTLLVWSLILSIALNISMFLIAFKAQSDKLTDISYAVTFMAIAALCGFWSDWSPLSIVLCIVVFIWGIRLGGFLLYRVSITGKDARFDEMRTSFWKFGQFWILQAVTVWVLMLPVVLAASVGNATVELLSWIGIVITLLGIIIESTADFQKFAFTRDKNNKGKWIEKGIWRYSRHPNYFGEILVWVGIFIAVIPVLSLGWLALAAISPLGIMTLLLFVSGIPILEASADKRWGNELAYREYKRRTSILIPLPLRRSLK